MDGAAWFVVGLVVFAVVGAVNMYFYERRKAREGHCGLPWRVFDMDSSGALGTRCQKCDAHGPWFSWYTKGLSSRKWAP